MFMFCVYNTAVTWNFTTVNLEVYFAILCVWFIDFTAVKLKKADPICRAF